MSLHETSRRRFLVRATVGAAMLPLLGQLATQRAAAALPPLSLTNAQAKALNYVEDATKVTSATFKPGSTCENCSFFTADTGACAIFPGFSVAPKGWCSGWALKKA
jgi:hypothetical protein